jgi:hypothetical protein
MCSVSVRRTAYRCAVFRYDGRPTDVQCFGTTDRLPMCSVSVRRTAYRCAVFRYDGPPADVQCFGTTDRLPMIWMKCSLSVTTRCCALVLCTQHTELFMLGTKRSERKSDRSSVFDVTNTWSYINCEFQCFCKCLSILSEPR